MNLLKELEKIDQEKGVCYLEDVKELISSAREELTKRSECSGCMTKPCTCYWERTVNLDDINEVLGDGK